MKALLLNPPHSAIGSRIPREHLPPLSLLALGGPLLDRGHEVKLLDADRDPMPTQRVVEEVLKFAPDAVLMGHSGSTSAHPSAMQVARAIRSASPETRIVYGGVYPTYYWRDILLRESAVDIIVRGEGEETAVRLLDSLEHDKPLRDVNGIAFRENRRGVTHVIATPDAAPVQDLDAHRIGWELVDHSQYTYWGDRRAVVVQFSRGCPHRCSYCGQRVFWRSWRHRDPVKFAAELARLHREHGVEVINFADENPTASRAAWKTFLEALIDQDVNLVLVGSTRAGDIVRDADILHLYKRAGVARFLMGIESTDERTLRHIQKGSSTHTDRQAIQLLRRHGIISMAACVAGFDRETDSDYWRMLRQLLAYDPDQIQLLYATPHAWTRFGEEQSQTRVIQTDLSRWDYKHQVLASGQVPNWRVLFWMKLIEAVIQLRPKSIYRLLAHPDCGFRSAMRWYYQIGRQVWPYELWHWLFHDRRTDHGPTLAEFQGIISAEAEPAIQPPTKRLQEVQKQGSRFDTVRQASRLSLSA